MQRRQLFTGLAALGMRDRAPSDLPMPVITAGLEAYTTPLTLDDVYHLFRRIGVGPTYAQAKSYVGRQASAVVDELLGADDEADPAPPGTWVSATTENPMGADLQTRFAIWGGWRNQMASLANWWLGKIAADTKGIEKLTMFWSGHFTTEFSFDETYVPPQSLWRQYLMLRKDRLGDFRRMVLDVTLDNAMVYYLGGHYNEVGRPNENYGRELLELFTVGIGWYTEGDVKEAARTLTGWKSARYNDEPTGPNGIYSAYFDAARHDTGAKQFLGQTIPARTADNNTEFQVKNEEVFRLIQIIFEQRPVEASRFIADKVYRYFVYSSPGDVNRDVVDQLAEAFRTNDWSIRAMMRALFTSAHFFDPAVRGAQIKTPAEFCAGVMRQLGVTANNPQDWSTKMDQSIMDPPTVAGWPGYHYWISTNSYPVRRQFARTVIDAMTDDQVMTFIKQFDDHTNADKFVRAVERFLLPMAVSDARHQFYVKALLQNAPDYDWPVILDDKAAAAQRTRSLLVTISKAPDFQLS